MAQSEIPMDLDKASVVDSDAFKYESILVRRASKSCF